MRTADELAHATAAGMMPEVPPGQRAAVVIVSEMTAKGPGPNAVRTVWRFINCTDPKLQATTLREIADLIEKTAKQAPG
jgi:hypothetical protein